MFSANLMSQLKLFCVLSVTALVLTDYLCARIKRQQREEKEEKLEELKETLINLLNRK